MATRVNGTQVEELQLWNVTFTAENQERLYAALNNFYPDYYMAGRSPRKYNHVGVTTMVALTEEEAVIISLTTGVLIEKVERTLSEINELTKMKNED